MNEWPIFHPNVSESEFPDCLLASSTMWSDFTPPPPHHHTHTHTHKLTHTQHSLIVCDDWEDNGERVTCNHDLFQGQEMNLWQDLFLLFVFGITGESGTLTSLQLPFSADTAPTVCQRQIICSVLFSVEKHMHDFVSSGRQQSLSQNYHLNTLRAQ